MAVYWDLCVDINWIQEGSKPLKRFRKKNAPRGKAGNAKHGVTSEKKLLRS